MPVIIVSSMLVFVYHDITNTRVSENEVLQILENYPYYIAFYEKYPSATHQDFNYHIPHRSNSVLTLSAENPETGNRLSVDMRHLPTDRPVEISDVECFKDGQIIKENDTSIEFLKTTMPIVFLILYCSLFPRCLGSHPMSYCYLVFDLL